MVSDISLYTGVFAEIELKIVIKKLSVSPPTGLTDVQIYRLLSFLDKHTSLECEITQIDYI